MNITIDGVTYAVEQFSDKVKELVSIATYVNSQVNTQSIELSKSQLFLANLQEQISQLVKDELEPKTEDEHAH